MITFRLIRSATVKIGFGSATLLIDPYLAGKFTRDSYTGKSRNPLIDLPDTIDEILSRTDAVVVSHLHSDHFDTVARQVISKNMKMFCQPSDQESLRSDGFTDVIPVEETAVFRDIDMRRFAGQHGYGEVLTQMGLTSGFIFHCRDEARIAWLGDTVLNASIEKILTDEKPDIVVVHASGAVWGDHVKIVCDAPDTINICKLLPRSKVVATHLDSLDHGTVTRKDLREYALQNGISNDQLIIPEDGEVLFF